MKRILRVGVLAFSLVGLLGVHAQPASASEVVEIAFNGNANIGAGYSAIGFPTSGTPPTTAPSKTTTPTVTTKTEHGVTHANLGGFHNSATVVFNHSAVAGCTAGKTTQNKVGKHAAGAGTCTIAASGLIHGYCGLSTATLSGTIHTSMNSATVPPTHVSQVYSFTVKVTVNVGVEFTGRIHNHTSGQSGSIVGTAASALLSGSCTDKNPKNFSITGQATART